MIHEPMIMNLTFKFSNFSHKSLEFIIHALESLNNGLLMNKWHKSTISEAFLTDNYRNTHSSPERVQNDHIPEGLMHLRLSSFGAEA